MRQHIDTAPVWEVYRQDCECPLCRLQTKVEAAGVDYFLGESVMEPSQRIEVNQKGFCGRHFRQLFDVGNRLGLALMTDTHMRETLRSMKTLTEAVKSSAAQQAGRGPAARLFRKRDVSGLDIAVEKLLTLEDRCALCERIRENMERYKYTVLYMYGHEAEFPKLFEASKGLCIRHFAEMLAMAPEHLSGEKLTRFVETLCDLELANLERIEGELDWFTRKFDYRNDDKPWGNSKDAVQRAINKLRGPIIDEKA